MKNLVFGLTLSVVVAAAFHVAGAQDVSETEAARVEKLRELASPNVSRELFKTPDEWRREFERDVRFAAARLFSFRGSEPTVRKYDPKEYDFGGAGRHSPAQIETLRLFAEPFLDLPRRPLTERQIDATATAFSVSRDDVALRAAALDAYIRFKYLESSDPAACLLFDVKATDDISTASYDELQASLAAVLENHSSLELLDEIQKRPRYDQTILLDCLLERVGDRLDDFGYAVALGDLVNLLLISVDETRAKRKEQERGKTAYELVENRLAKAEEARPQSWEVAYVVAATLWRLPTTFTPGDGSNEPPKRVRYYPGVKPPAATLYSHERDRAAVIRALARALPNACAADPSEEKSVVRPVVVSESNYNVDVNLRSYFDLFRQALQNYKPGRFVCDENRKTNLSDLPPLDAAPIDSPSGSGWLDRFRVPDSFDDAANDGERFAYIASKEPAWLANERANKKRPTPPRPASKRQTASERRSDARRVLLIGDETVVDSITQSYGFTNELRNFSAQENLDVEFIPLGIRRSTFADWRALLARARSENVPTDVDGVSIKTELDKGADIVLLFLGFNDARRLSFKGLNYDEFRLRPNGELALEVGAPLREEVAGLVADLQAWIPQCRIVLASVWPEIGGVPKLISYVAAQETLAVKESDCDVVALDGLPPDADADARFAAEEIRVSNDEFRFNRYASQLMAWATLLALDPNLPFDAALKRAKQTYWTQGRVVPNPPPSLGEWETRARRYFETCVDRRLYDRATPGFTIAAHWELESPWGQPWTGPVYEKDEDRREAILSKVHPVYVVVSCQTREIELDPPSENGGADKRSGARGSMDIMGIWRRPLAKTPPFVVVSCGNLKFMNFGAAQETRDGNSGRTTGNFQLIFNGTLADLPCDVTIALNGVQKTVRVEPTGGYKVSGVFPLGREFSSLEDFPQEKTITRVDFSALAGEETSSIDYDLKRRIEASRTSVKEPLSKSLREGPNPESSWELASWELASGASRPSSEDDTVGSRRNPDKRWIDVAAYRPPESFAGVYLVLNFNSPKNQTGTLKLGVKGYKTHVVERVYLNREQVFFGELNVDDPEKNEASIPVALKKGENVIFARVDHTQWDWIVGFALLDEKGRELEDSLNRW